MQDKNEFYKLVRDPIFLSAFFSWFCSQLLKFIINFIRRSNRSRDMVGSMLWITGGMPSSHSAAVTAIATAVAYQEGISSPLFIVAFIYGIIVIRDALGVRRATGLQAHTINLIGKEIQHRFKTRFIPVKEIHGHTIAEVSVGIILGFFIATAFCRL